MSDVRRSPKWRWALAVSAFGVVLLAAATAGAQDSVPLTVQGLDTSGYPSVSFTVTVPSALAGDGAVTFEVAENGERVQDPTVEHLQGDVTPPEVVLVIDASGSMKGAPIADAKVAATAFIDSLGADARVALVAFSDTVTVLSGFGQPRQTLERQIEGLGATGETALYDALATAATVFPADGKGQRAIVVLSDGGDTVSARSFETAVAEVTAAGVPVYAVALQSEEYNPQALATMAQATSGRLLAVGESTALAGSFEAIAEEIKDAYQVTYTSEAPATKDIELDVTATSAGGTASAAVVYANPEYSWSRGEEETGASVRVLAPNARFLMGAVILAFASASLLAFGLLALVSRERTRLADLHFYDQLHGASTPPSGGAAEQVRDKVVGAIAQVAGRGGFTQAIGLKLEQAGLPLRPAEYMTAHIVTVFLSGVFTQLLLGNFVLSSGMVLLVSFAPIVMLDLASASRRDRFEAQLPDILAMLASSLRGGWGLLQAVEFVVAQAGPPAAAEFRRVQTEARLGMPLEEALQNMGRRIGSPDLDAAVTAIVIQREVGGNLAEVLDIVAKTIRDRAALSRQVRALTAEGRLSAYILIGLPFVEALALAAVSPGYLAPLVTTVPGLAMLVGSLCLLAIGAWWLRAITQIEV